jgi:hypothetical protein
MSTDTERDLTQYENWTAEDIDRAVYQIELLTARCNNLQTKLDKLAGEKRDNTRKN